MDMIVQVYSECILPCYQNVCDVYVQNKHLLAPEGLYTHPMVMASNACGVDHKAETNDIAAEFFNRFVCFALNYKALMRRWEAGDTSIVQPTEPNPTNLLFFVIAAMTIATGAREMVSRRHA
jgi:hypothetical protein